MAKWHILLPFHVLGSLLRGDIQHLSNSCWKVHRVCVFLSMSLVTLIMIPPRYDGDYVDADGVALTDGGGTLVLETHGDVCVFTP